MKQDHTGANLIGTDLVGVKLRDYDFTGSNMTCCNFTRAALYNCKFAGVDFSGSNFTQCVMDECSLLDANLQFANLTGTYLVRTDLANCNFYDAIVSNTLFAESPLNGANGILCKHIANNLVYAVRCGGRMIYSTGDLRGDNYTMLSYLGRESEEIRKALDSMY